MFIGLPQHFLYFLPEPHGHGALRCIFAISSFNYGRITISRGRAAVARYLYSQGGETIGYMDNRDKYLYNQQAQIIAYWDSRHKYMYTQRGEVYGYLAEDGRYLYSQSGGIVGYFQPRYEEDEQE
jgi:hypothetical protein